MASGESKWITGSAARQDVQHWRAISGAVITGIETVIADDCQLNVRSLNNFDIETVAQPKRVVLDRQGRLPLNAKILENPETVMVMGPYRQELADLGVIQLEIQPLKCCYRPYLSNIKFMMCWLKLAQHCLLPFARRFGGRIDQLYCLDLIGEKCKGHVQCRI